ncbi:hypothetical protein V496_04859 [Pseudogymnoascus sp. VKM F-4515 (FW-2607)]|nr:hypothetical protein V496_04859 [Pseudogymnoascus sp. VKM F-4515 (FW-2607)]KFY94001.1 hypothetical protein V498_04103 [Pseudogymnoascus sp. VKM F-4517 (FW-2822)]
MIVPVPIPVTGFPLTSIVHRPKGLAQISPSITTTYPTTTTTDINNRNPDTRHLQLPEPRISDVTSSSTRHSTKYALSYGKNIATRPLFSQHNPERRFQATHRAVLPPEECCSPRYSSHSPPRYRSSSSPRRRSPPTQRVRQPNEIPYRIANESYDRPGQFPRRPPTDSSSEDEAPVRQPFASQQYFEQHGQPRAGQHAPPARSDYIPQHDVSVLASPANSTSPPPRPVWSPEDALRQEGSTIKVRDLAHIQSFATEEFLTNRASEYRALGREATPKYEIAAMPVADIIEMVAGLLTKITTTNDRQHEHLHMPLPPSEGNTNMSGLTTSVLAFHGKNVPSITILSYLSRVHKYCPLTYEVFLSLLVYFDRMTERVNAGPTDSSREAASSDGHPSRPSTGLSTSRIDDSEMPRTPMSGLSVNGSIEDTARAQYATPPDEDSPQYNLAHYFVVDSYNIHRLLISGVTCASKFFSDTFYTNSRYAKVGGLPLAELNHLELQFLLLNDFRLAVPVEELEAYGTMLVEFYAREVVAQREQQRSQPDVASSMAYADDS